MKNFMNKVTFKKRRAAITGICKLRQLGAKTSAVLAQQSGEGFVDSALKILISVVIGALLLAGLYALFNDTVLPTLVQRVKDLFNYAG